MIKWLNNQDALTLASRFDLSGGEIENIARKHSVNAILSGKDSVDLQHIMATCQQERLSQTNRPVIGFWHLHFKPMIKQKEAAPIDTASFLFVLDLLS